MAAFTEAIEATRTTIGCVSRARPLLSVRHEHGIDLATRWLAGPAPLVMPAPLRGAALVATDSVRRVDGPRGSASALVVVSYLYALLDRDGAELLAFHWHPEPRFAAPIRPHVHVSATLRPRQPNGDRGIVPLDKRHIPTGPVSLADVVRMLVEEFGAEPLVADWRTRLVDANEGGALG